MMEMPKYLAEATQWPDVIGDLEKIKEERCEEFENEVIKWTYDPLQVSDDRYLMYLFKTKEDCVDNKNFDSVVCRVATLNRLYGGGVRNENIIPLAKRIHRLAEREKLDEKIQNNKDHNYEAIKLIAKKDETAGDETVNQNCLVFASKYCNFLKPDVYPMIDSRMRKALFAYNRNLSKDKSEEKARELYTKYMTTYTKPDHYYEFVEEINRLTDLVKGFDREFYGVKLSNYKKLDKLIWNRMGKELKKMRDSKKNKQ